MTDLGLSGVPIIAKNIIQKLWIDRLVNPQPLYKYY